MVYRRGRDWIIEASWAGLSVKVFRFTQVAGDCAMGCQVAHLVSVLAILWVQEVASSCPSGDGFVLGMAGTGDACGFIDVIGIVSFQGLSMGLFFADGDEGVEGQGEDYRAEVYFSFKLIDFDDGALGVLLEFRVCAYGFEVDFSCGGHGLSDNRNPVGVV